MWTIFMGLCESKMHLKYLLQGNQPIHKVLQRWPQLRSIPWIQIWSRGPFDKARNVDIIPLMACLQSDHDHCFLKSLTGWETSDGLTFVLHKVIKSKVIMNEHIVNWMRM